MSKTESAWVLERMGSDYAWVESAASYGYRAKSHDIECRRAVISAGDYTAWYVYRWRNTITGEIETIETYQEQPKPSGKGREIAPLVISDLLSRVDKGVRTYGEPLRADNGRDPLRDAYEEALDLCMYLRQAMEERNG